MRPIRVREPRRDAPGQTGAPLPAGATSTEAKGDSPAWQASRSRQTNGGRPGKTQPPAGSFARAAGSPARPAAASGSGPDARPSGRLGRELAQNVVQQAAVAEVFDLLRGQQQYVDLEALLAAIGGACDHG